MAAACRDAGLAPPLLEEIGTRFRVTLRLGRVGPPTLDETEEAIVRVLRDSRGHLTSEIARAIRLTPRATRSRLLRLIERGLVREVGTSPQDPKRRYFLSS
jgi:ATP-dependent DNA helicase RecG